MCIPTTETINRPAAACDPFVAFLPAPRRPRRREQWSRGGSDSGKNTTNTHSHDDTTQRDERNSAGTHQRHQRPRKLHDCRLGRVSARERRSCWVLCGSDGHCSAPTCALLVRNCAFSRVCTAVLGALPFAGGAVRALCGACAVCCVVCCPVCSSPFGVPRIGGRTSTRAHRGQAHSTAAARAQHTTASTRTTQEEKHTLERRDNERDKPTNSEDTNGASTSTSVQARMTSHPLNC